MFLAGDDAWEEAIHLCRGTYYGLKLHVIIFQ